MNDQEFPREFPIGGSTVAEVLNNAAAVFDQIFEDNLHHQAVRIFAAVGATTKEQDQFLREQCQRYVSEMRPEMLRTLEIALMKTQAKP